MLILQQSVYTIIFTYEANTFTDVFKFVEELFLQTKTLPEYVDLQRQGHLSWFNPPSLATKKLDLNDSKLHSII